MATFLKCPKCGKKNISVKAVKCPNCGHDLSKAKKDQLGMSSEEIQKIKQEAEKDRLSRVDENSEKKKINREKENRQMIIIAVSLGVLMMVGVFVALTMDQKSNGKTTTTTEATTTAETDTSAPDGVGSYEIDGIQDPMTYFTVDMTYKDAVEALGTDAKPQNLEGISYLFDYGSYAGCNDNEEMDAAFKSNEDDAALIDYCWCAEITEDQFAQVVQIYDQKYGTEQKNAETGIHYSYAEGKDHAYLYVDSANKVEYEFFATKSDNGFVVQLYMTPME